MSKLSEVMAKVVAEQKSQPGYISDEQSAEMRRQRKAKRAADSTANTEPSTSQFDADHETSRGIRSVWD